MSDDEKLAIIIFGEKKVKEMKRAEKEGSNELYFDRNWEYLSWECSECGRTNCQGCVEE